MYNKVIMIGNLTRDIELKYIPSGAAIAKGAIATSHKYKTQSGEQKDEVCFLDFSVFGKSAEILNQYVRKGSKVMLEGRLVFEQWTANDGSNRSRHTLRVETFKFLDSKADGMNNQNIQASSGYNNYNQNQGQNSYNNNQAGGYNPQQQQAKPQPAYNSQQQQQYCGMPEPMAQNIPEINIDEDEIPF
jgi:single-strand DNA-binding protein